MKNLLIFVTGISLLLLSCNNDKPGKQTTTPVTIPLASFKVVIINHPVKDFATWKKVYMAHDSLRQVYDVSRYNIGRGMEDSNLVIVIDKIKDVQKAKDFGASTDLKTAMEKAGVGGPPTISFVDVIRNDSTKIDIKDRVMVVHKVKDFDAWLRVFDGEGMEKRKENGIIDRGLGRGVDDSTMVYIVFAISDMEKAKARIISEELKKIMTDAGVEGPPQFTFYKLVD